jgi:hypothetical protein
VSIAINDLANYNRPALASLHRHQRDGGRPNRRPDDSTAVGQLTVRRHRLISRRIRKPRSQPTVCCDGVLRLRVDTFDPTALTPGDSCWGSDIDTRQSFRVGNGLIFLARSRVVAPITGGIVASLFSYALHGGLRDEPDWELLTNEPVGALTKIFNGQGLRVRGDLSSCRVRASPTSMCSRAIRYRIGASGSSMARP